MESNQSSAKAYCCPDERKKKETDTAVKTDSSSHGSKSLSSQRVMVQRPSQVKHERHKSPESRQHEKMPSEILDFERSPAANPPNNFKIMSNRFNLSPDHLPYGPTGPLQTERAAKSRNVLLLDLMTEDDTPSAGR